jgi:hypothetical protein
VRIPLQIAVWIALAGSAHAQSPADCHELFGRADVERDYELKMSELAPFQQGMKSSQVRQSDPAAISYEEFMIACRKGAFARVEQPKANDWSGPPPEVNEPPVSEEMNEQGPQFGKLPQGLRVTHLIGTPVYTMDDEQVGRIRDLVVSGDVTHSQVVLGVGGFLGLGEQYVTVEISQLRFITRDNELAVVLDATKRDLSKFDVDP